MIKFNLLLFCRIISDSESVFEENSVSENESVVDFVFNNVHLLEEQSALLNLSNDAINIQPSLFSDTVVNEVPAVLSQIPFDTSIIVFSSNIEGEPLTLPAMTDSKERGKALKSDFKSMYADFHIAG